VSLLSPLSDCRAWSNSETPRTQPVRPPFLYPVIPQSRMLMICEQTTTSLSATGVPSRCPLPSSSHACLVSASLFSTSSHDWIPCRAALALTLRPAPGATMLRIEVVSPARGRRIHRLWTRNTFWIIIRRMNCWRLMGLYQRRSIRGLREFRCESTGN
jgi:hypothetical protein